MLKDSQINPFVIGKYVSVEYFCDREEETELLRKQLINGRNVTLVSDRRIGKSGLISHLFAQQDIREQFYTVSIDLYSTGSLAEMVCMFSDAVYRTVQKHTSSWKDKFFQVISSLRVGFKLDPLSASPTLDVGVGDVPAPAMTLEQIFAFLELADKPCIVAFDEFQQITNYDERNVEALLRTHIQLCQRTHFIFAGSRKHLMAQMFLSPAKPFYQSTMNLALEPIAKDIYTDFACAMFRKASKELDRAAAERIYDMFHGITWYMQVMMNEMFTLTAVGQTCSTDSIDTAMQNIVRLQEPFYRELLSAMPSKQKALLYAIAKEGNAVGLTSAEFISRHSLSSASSVQAAMRGLREKDLVTEENNTSRIYDVFMEQYILHDILGK